MSTVQYCLLDKTEKILFAKEMLQKLNKSVDFMKKCVILRIQKSYEVFI